MSASDEFTGIPIKALEDETPTTTSFQLSEEQSRAADAVGAWLKDRSKPWFYLGGFAGCGKAQPLTARIITPLGPIKMGDLTVGDFVIGSNGKPTKVIGIFPQGKRQVYKVTFRDGSSTRCDSEHIWKVKAPFKGSKGKWLKRTTQQILESGVSYYDKTRNKRNFKFQIPLCAPVEFSSFDKAPIDPYMLGALLGDGYCSGNVVALVCNDLEIVDRIAKTLPEGMEISTTRSGGSAYRHVIRDNKEFHSNRLKIILESLGINIYSFEKFIPTRFLFAPIEDRLELLRGIMDTDGCVVKNRVSLSSTSEKLVKDVTFLVQSLGGTAILYTYKRPDRKRTEYVLNVKLGICPFYLKRKAEAWKPSLKNPPSRYITSIEEDGYEEQQCIAVEASDNLYLTDDFIVTHNTSLARYLSELQNGSTRFMAYTGKAARVLQRKGCPAGTIHQAIYLPSGEINDEIQKLEEELNGEPSPDPVRTRKIIHRLTELREPKFTLRPLNPFKGVSLIVLDECSMVADQCAQDLMSFKVPILVLGDPGQLPPVKGSGFFTRHKPDFMLEEIHRQVADSPILQLATAARKGDALRQGKYGDSRVIGRSRFGREELLAVEQAICGTHKSRLMFNAEVRQAKGFEGVFPCEGERLTCLRNNAKTNVLNGEIYESLEAYDETTKEILIRDEDGHDKTIKVHPECFTDPKLLASWPFQKRATREELDYAYTITCHRAQGSQWRSVAVYADMFRWADARNDFKKWLYTAITRASESVIVAL
jgi:exodeoxyribonuclease-5